MIAARPTTGLRVPSRLRPPRPVLVAAPDRVALTIYAGNGDKNFGTITGTSPASPHFILGLNVGGFRQPRGLQ